MVGLNRGLGFTNVKHKRHEQRFFVDVLVRSRRYVGLFCEGVLTYRLPCYRGSRSPVCSLNKKMAEK